VDRPNTSIEGFAPALTPLPSLLVQRLFSTFPSGSPGLGLLLLRVGVAAALLMHSMACLGDGHRTWGTAAVAVLAGLSGALLLIGLMTPLAGVLAVLSSAGVSLSWLPSPTPNAFDVRLTSLLVVLAATAIALLGPGAFSLDAALFGRREIRIPQRRDAPSVD
jgi:hypothetical protein